jgi:1,4-dihydroxy-2-naphthoate octaprenyltransferase
MVAPVLLGASIAWFVTKRLDPLLFSIALLGAVLLHLAANAIDDVYDLANGVDAVSDRMFPKDAPGWKPMARGLISARAGLRTSYLLYASSMLAGLYLSLVVGWLALGIALPGIFLSYFYTAPPLKLDYRGLGLGEVAVLFTFGPIPALGLFYVLTGSLSLLPVLASIPTGLLTMDVLISHDQIFYDAYKASGKNSLLVLLGRKRGAQAFTAIGVLSYVLVTLLVALRQIPLFCLIVLLALPLFLSVADVKGVERAPPEYGPRTLRAFLHSVLFTGLLAIGFVI